MQPAEALCPEEQGSFLDWPTLLHQEHKVCWLEEDNYEDHALQSQGNFHIPSNQLCTGAAFPCKSDITELADKEAHLLCPISNTQRKRLSCVLSAQTWKIGAAGVPFMLFTVSRSILSQIYGNLPR